MCVCARPATYGFARTHMPCPAADMDVAGEAAISFSELCICLRVVPPKLPPGYPPCRKGFKHVLAAARARAAREAQIRRCGRALRFGAHVGGICRPRGSLACVHLCVYWMCVLAHIVVCGPSKHMAVCVCLEWVPSPERCQLGAIAPRFTFHGICIHKNACSHAGRHTCTLTQVRARTRTRTCARTHTHGSVRTHSHTHTRTHTPMFAKHTHGLHCP